MGTHYERVMEIATRRRDEVDTLIRGLPDQPKSIKILQERIKGEARAIVKGRVSRPSVRQFQDFSTFAMLILKALMEKDLDTNTDPFSLFEFNFRERNRVTDLLDGVEIPPEQQFVELTRTYHMVTFERAGKKIYEMSPGLADRLLHTELRGVDAEDLRLPYPAVYMIIPTHLQFKINVYDTGWHEVDGVYITEDNKLVFSDTTSADTPPRGWRIMLVGKSKNEDVFDDALFFFTVSMPEGQKIDDCLDAALDLWAHENHGQDITTIRSVFRLLMNAILYATSSEAELFSYIRDKETRQLLERLKKAEGKKREKIKAQLKNKSRQEIILLGRSIKAFEEKGDGTGKPMEVRVRVAGHWRHYWIGQGRSERVRRWISPFWRGPQDGLPINPIHHLTEPREGQGYTLCKLKD
jgi:hypothetical protein